MNSFPSKMSRAVVVIKTDSPMKAPSKQTIREQQDLNRRIKLNQAKYGIVSEFMERFFDGKLQLKGATALAENLSAHFGLKLDRKAKRHKPAIICWFCENWETVLPLLLKIKGINIEPISPPNPVQNVEQPIKQNFAEQEQFNFCDTNLDLDIFSTEELWPQARH